MDLARAAAWVLKRWNIILLACLAFSLILLIRPTGFSTDTEDKIENIPKSERYPQFEQTLLKSMKSISSTLRKAAMNKDESDFDDLKYKIQLELAETFPNHFSYDRDLPSSNDNSCIINLFTDCKDNFENGLSDVIAIVSLHEGADPVACVAYNPNTDEYFSAHAGGGFKHDASQRSSKIIEIYSKDSKKMDLSILPSSMKGKKSTCPSLAMIQVATGKVDGFVYLDKRPIFERKFGGPLLFINEAGLSVYDEAVSIVGEESLVTKLTDLYS